MGMLFGGWAKDAQEERDYWVKQLGEEGYKQKLAKDEDDRKYALMHPKPTKWSSSEPKVTIGDIIGFWNAPANKLENESYIRDILNGNILVTSIDNKEDRQSFIWEGPYIRVCNAFINKKDLYE